MDKLLEALRVAIVEEFFLEIGSRRFGGGTLRRRHRYIARRRGLHLSVAGRGKLDPLGVRIGVASEKAAQPQISETEAVRIGREPEAVGGRLIIERNPGI